MARAQSTKRIEQQAKSKMGFHQTLLSSFTLLLIVVVLQAPPTLGSTTQLRHHFYRESCPNVESIVRSAVKKKLQETFVTAPGTLRLFFHDCFVQGCDASILLASPSNNAERDSPDDLSVAGDGFDTVVRAKAAVDGVAGCRNKVSCADILAMAARDVVALTGGPEFQVELGRRDGRVSRKESVRNQLPHADFNYKKLASMFASHGLSQVDLIALSGAHTIGFSHCSFFEERIYTKSGNKLDPSLDPRYAAELRKMCPRQVDPRIAVPMDPASPTTFDNAYYANILRGRGLFTSDQTLLSTRKSRRVVSHFAKNTTLFESVFAAAMVRLGRVGVKTGGEGEVRRDCSFVNR